MTTMKNIITKIVGWLNKIGADKYKHSTLGEFIAAVVILILDPFAPKWLVVSAAAVTFVTAGIGKEKIDEKTDGKDVLATCLGGIIVCVTYLIG